MIILINNSITCGTFPNNLKLADITPAHKSGERQDKRNYRPVSILPPISKIYERILHNQLYNTFDNILSISQCGFRKGFSAQHCLIVMLEKFKESIDKNGSWFLGKSSEFFKTEPFLLPIIFVKSHIASQNLSLCSILHL